ncbi:MAG: hypothetical protein HY696_11990 [Deltaproteobacteria bacterium]|nr:hypothetical protein [Deltaproteobacteria bacterium]
MKKFEDLKSEIVEKLKERAPNFQCPVCSTSSTPHRKLILIDGYFNRPLQKELTGALVIGGPAVPTFGIVCENCGHVMEFSLGALGLLQKE